MSALLAPRARGGLATLALLALGAAPPPTADAAAAALDVHASAAVQAPQLTLTDATGAQADLAPRAGEVVLVTFWASWCDTCRAELPQLLALGRELAVRHPARFRVIGVSMDQDRPAVQDYLRRVQRSTRTPGWMVLLDTPDQSALIAYYTAARTADIPDEYQLPQTYVVSRSGRLVGWLEGPREWSSPAARAYVEALLR